MTKILINLVERVESAEELMASMLGRFPLLPREVAESVAIEMKFPAQMAV